MRNLFLLVIASTALQLTAQTTQSITLEDIWANGTFRAQTVPGFNFLNDGKHYATFDGTKLTQISLLTGLPDSTLFDATASNALPTGVAKFDDYTLSHDQQKILFQTNQEQIYRRSSKAYHYIWDNKTQTITPVYAKAPQSNANFSPKADHIAFSSGNNLFVQDLKTNQVTQITQDGEVGKIINGMTDWVYEEEFQFTKAFEWSPDGEKIAFLRFDESEVKEYTLQYFEKGEYPRNYTYKYPKVGEKNAVVTAYVYDVKSGKITPIPVGSNTDIYLPRIVWTPDNRLCIERLNRHQNELELLLANTQTGETSVFFKETNPAYVDVNTDKLTFLRDGKHFVRLSESDGFQHIYLYDMQGKVVRQLTKGTYDVFKYYGIDEQRGFIYYQSDEYSPLDKTIFRVGLNGRNKIAMSEKEGNSDAEFSTTFDYYILTHSNINTPPTYAVYDASTAKIVRSLEDNAGIRSKQTTFGAAPLEFFQFTTSEAVQLNGWMLKPKNFDPAKKYPVFMTQYSGPNSQSATNTWGGSNYWWYQLLAQKGYIVACVDGRGTGGRGEAFRKITYKQLGKYETMDQIEAAKYFGTLPYVDAKRIGIFGWSYGGYMSSLCILKGADVFKAAIAVAPVTNWKWYDGIYTERYMQTEQENPEGYRDNSPVNFADHLKGSFLIIHGVADDNVHFQNSAEMVNALVKANKPFDSFYYPNRNHGISGGTTRLHLYHKMTDFILDKL